jgi:hypothetical protein
MARLYRDLSATSRVVDRRPVTKSGPQRPNDDGPRRPGVLALVLVALGVVGALLLVRELRRSAALQDCVLTGRTNCAPIDAADHGG